MRGFFPSRRMALAGAMLFFCGACLFPLEAHAGPSGAKARGGSHLYVFLGLGNGSPGLPEFGSKIGRRGIPTTVQNHAEWPAATQDAIARYKSGRVRSILIVGHSLGGAAATSMAAELAKADVPVQFVAMLDPVFAAAVPANVRRTVTILPGNGENHLSVIAAHEGELTRHVLGNVAARGVRVLKKRRHRR